MGLAYLGPKEQHCWMTRSASTKGSLSPLPDQPLRKAVFAVHTSASLTAFERKTYNVLLLHAYSNLLSAREHSFLISDLQLILGSESRNRKHLIEALSNLRSKDVKFNLLEDQLPQPLNDGPTAKPFTDTSLLGEFAVDGGRIYYSYGPRMAAALYDPEPYALINVRVMTSIRSMSALALYENCSRFIGTGSTGAWDLPLFRQLIGATSSHYDEYKRLSQKVINPAINEINQKSDILIDLEVIKGKGKGAPVEAVRFKVRRNPQSTLFGMSTPEDENIKNTASYKAAVALGIGPQLAKQIASAGEWGTRLIEKIKNSRHTPTPIRNPAAFAKSAIANAYDIDGMRPGQTPAADTAAPTPPSLPSTASTIAPEVPRRLDAAKLPAFDQFRFRFELLRLRAYLWGLTAEKRQEIIDHFKFEKPAVKELVYEQIPEGLPRDSSVHTFENWAKLHLRKEIAYTVAEFQEWLDNMPPPPPPTPKSSKAT